MASEALDPVLRIRKGHPAGIDNMETQTEQKMGAATIVDALKLIASRACAGSRVALTAMGRFGEDRQQLYNYAAKSALQYPVKSGHKEFTAEERELIVRFIK